ncbi:MAG: hypothetical protein ACXWYD_16630, partial [Candidatus Binatia bacterium]
SFTFLTYFIVRRFVWVKRFFKERESADCFRSAIAAGENAGGQFDASATFRMPTKGTDEP